MKTTEQLKMDFEKVNLPSTLYTYSRIAPVKPTIVFDTYWRFAAERQKIFFSRILGEKPPWTEDDILRKHKFTNVYRASDRVSQYLIKNVIYKGDQSIREIFFRTLLFKFFNKIETWELLCSQSSEIHSDDFNISSFDKCLTGAISRGERIYSAAYIMPSGGRGSDFKKKHQMHLHLLDRMLKDNVPDLIANAGCMYNAFKILKSYPSIGDFLAYQYIIDLNYSSFMNFDEMEFVVPGPGARDGIRKCFADLGGLCESDIVKLVADNQAHEFTRLGIDFQTLWGRPLQLIDCQNLFCEVDKYSRIKHPEFSGHTGRTRIKQKLKINQNRIDFWYPPKWNINHLIKQTTS